MQDGILVAFRCRLSRTFHDKLVGVFDADGESGIALVGAELAQLLRQRRIHLLRPDKPGSQRSAWRRALTNLAYVAGFQPRQGVGPKVGRIDNAKIGLEPTQDCCPESLVFFYRTKCPRP